MAGGDFEPVTDSPFATKPLYSSFTGVSATYFDPRELHPVERQLCGVDLIEHQGRVRSLDDPVEAQPLAVEADRRVEPAEHDGEVVVEE